MLSFIKKLFGSNPVEVEVPYKVETPSFPAPKSEDKPAKTPVAKKAGVKKATTRKPRAPKA
jgi:hypothetical protein